MMVLILAWMIFPIITYALEAYIIGPDDILEIKFWQDETNRLNASVKVRQDGKIAVDIIGEIEAAGKTTSELEREIVRQMSRYNQSISQTVVRVVEYGFQKVYVSGQVLNPGKYTFEKIPDLWTLINEAGGITENGDLTRVAITRAETRDVEVVNVAAAIAAGKADELPLIVTGDAIEIARLPGGLESPTSLSYVPGKRNIFYVAGEINNPGQYTLEENIDLLDAISIAGGPTDRANLNSVKIISKVDSPPYVTKVNLKKYTETGSPGRVMIRPEDNIVVDRRGGGFLGLGSITDIVALLGAVSTAVLLYDTITRE
jgi:polysaccharide export outer membrane protein